MAEIIGNIATQPEKRTAQGSGDDYFTFRLAENTGRGDNRRATWFDVRAKLSQEQADLLVVGQLVCVTGRVEPSSYVKKKALEGVPVPQTWNEVIKTLKERNALGTSLVLLTSSVKQHEFKPPA